MINEIQNKGETVSGTEGTWHVYWWMDEISFHRPSQHSQTEFFMLSILPRSTQTVVKVVSPSYYFSLKERVTLSPGAGGQGQSISILLKTPSRCLNTPPASPHPTPPPGATPPAPHTTPPTPPQEADGCPQPSEALTPLRYEANKHLYPLFTAYLSITT